MSKVFFHIWIKKSNSISVLSSPVFATILLISPSACLKEAVIFIIFTKFRFQISDCLISTFERKTTKNVSKKILNLGRKAFQEITNFAKYLELTSHKLQKFVYLT